ncbi:MAG: hypothetical protein AAGA75_17090 [Cyanobacteria bacterium P01_E01_bin.6]
MTYEMELRLEQERRERAAQSMEMDAPVEVRVCLSDEEIKKLEEF